MPSYPPLASRARLLLAALCLLLAGHGASALPESFHAEFAVASNGSTVGRTVWTLEPVGKARYRFRSVTRATGLLSLLVSGKRTEESVWMHHEGRIRPLEYHYVRTGRKAREVDVLFDWDALEAVNRHGGDSWKLDIAAGTHDKLVYLLALMKDLAAGAPALNYAIADGGRLKEYRIARRGEEQVATPVGTFTAVKLHRRDPKGKRHTTLWAAPALAYLPVKVRQEDKDGDVVTMTLDTLEGLERE